MPTTSAEIYARIASFSHPVVLPGPWSLLPADPAWGLLDAAAFLPAISEQFSDDDLLEAHVFVEGNYGPVLNPAFGIGPQLTFVSRPAPELEPSAILPGATSLDGQPAWQQILAHHRNVNLVDENENLLVSNEPLDLMVASSCGLLAAPLPPVAKINSRFLSDLAAMLARPGAGGFLHHPSMVVLAWELAAFSLDAPSGFDEVADHCTKFTSIFEPVVPLNFWKTHPKTLHELRFVLGFGTELETAEYLRGRIADEAATLEPPNVQPPEPPSNPIFDYWAAAGNAASSGMLADLRTAYLEHLGGARMVVEEPSADVQPAYGLAQVIELSTAIELIESVADRLNPRERGPHERRLSSITDVVAAAQRLLQTQGAASRRQNPPSQIEHLRAILP